MIKRVLVIGGYGNFGSFICQKLKNEENVQLLIAGRSLDKSQQFSARLKAINRPDCFKIDIQDCFDQALALIKPDIVIHTSGPFQNQSYEVAKACINYGCHYIDLADGREFVSGIQSFHQKAQEKGVTIISGASSVPCLTSAVIDHYQPQFQKLTSVDYAITTAQLTNTGLATTAAILSYVGQPFQTLIDGQMKTIYGWQDLHSHVYPELGRRLLGNCDIPDLVLFPQRYKDIHSLRFYAGIEVPFVHLGLWFLSWLVRLGFIRNLKKYASLLQKVSRFFDIFGSDRSAFHMALTGLGSNNAPKKETFYIIAKSGHGPFIPSIPAVILTKMLVRGQLSQRGAFPCVGFISIEQYMEELKDLDIKTFKR